MTAKDIDIELEKIYNENIGIFNKVSQYSYDYSYPTFIKCTDKYAQSDTKILFLDYESSLWYRDENSDDATSRENYRKIAPWVYGKTCKTVKDYTFLYKKFNKEDRCLLKDKKSEFWKAIDVVMSLMPQAKSVVSLFSFICKSDINYRNKDGQLKKDKKETAEFMKRMDSINYKITAREINILKPDFVFVFSNGNTLGNGRFYLDQVFGQKTELLPVEETKNLLYVSQSTYLNTDFFMLPDAKECNKKKLSDLGKALKNLLTKEYA